MFPGFPALNVNYHLAVDGINFPLIILNGFVCVTGILFSWNIENRVKEFFAFFLTLIAGVYGVFMSMDLFLLFVFYELAIIPKYFVIAIWGRPSKEYGAMKLVLYSFVGSALVFIGILAVFFSAGGQSFDILELVKHPLAPEVQIWVFPLIFVGFAVLAGMWPFHTWAPTGHVAAPTAASMLLAGVVMKLGSYGCFRAAMLLFPQGLEHWRWWIAGYWRSLASYMAREWRWCRRISSLSLVTRASAIWVSCCSGWRHSTSWACRAPSCKCSPTASWRAFCLPLSVAWFTTAPHTAVGRVGRTGQGDSFRVRHLCHWRCGLDRNAGL